MDAVIVSIAADDHEVAEGFKGSENVEPAKATEIVNTETTEGTA